MSSLIFFTIGVVSAWAIGTLSHGGLSQNPRRRGYFMMASICALVASTGGILKNFIETLNF